MEPIYLLFSILIAYPQEVSTTLTSNTTVDTNIDGNVTLECLYSEQAPTVTLQYEVSWSNN